MILTEPHSVSSMCDVLGVSRSGFYAWRDERLTERERRDQELMPMVQEIFHRHKRRYGARRIALDMNALGELCGVGRVAKLLKKQGLNAIQPKSFRPRTTESRHRLGYSANLLLDRHPPVRVDEVWVADITYIPLRGTNRFAYLALEMDLFSRKLIGWELLEHMSEELVLAALRQGIRIRQPAAGLIHHSDRGGQYAGKQFRGVLRRAAMLQSMSRAADCYDNAFLESCFGTIKTELEIVEYQDSNDAHQEIAEYITYYNNDRRHSSLGYLTPTQFEAQNASRK